MLLQEPSLLLLSGQVGLEQVQGEGKGVFSRLGFLEPWKQGVISVKLDNVEKAWRTQTSSAQFSKPALRDSIWMLSVQMNGPNGDCLGPGRKTRQLHDTLVKGRWGLGMIEVGSWAGPSTQ